MDKYLRIIGRGVVYIAAATVRLVFIVVGWFFVPLTLISDGGYRTPPLWRPVYGNVEEIPQAAKKNRWTKYVEMAWRNPVTGLDAMIAQPMPEQHPNPDAIVRKGTSVDASRFMADDLFWEYWYLRRVVIKRFGYVRFFEFRIGWKFVDGNDDFVPTLQFGLKR